MLKKNLFQKILNKLVLSTTKRIESFFSLFRDNFSYKKFFFKFPKNVNKKVFLSLVAMFTAVISYFLIPAFYDENKIKAQLENQILNKYNLKVKLDKTLGYGLLPQPHFLSKDAIIEDNLKEISYSENLKIFINPKNFFSPDKLKIKNLLFNKTDFKIDSSNFKFFVEVLNNNRSDHDIDFINNKFFYLDSNDDVIFLSSLKSLNYSYPDKFLKKLNSKFNIFNIPISLDVEHNIIENFFFIKIKSRQIRLNVKINSNYDDEKLDGELDFTVVNKKKKVNYKLEGNNLNFNAEDNKFKGYIDLKPFYLYSALKFYQVDLKKIFKDNSIFTNIIKLEILNNQNLNGRIDVKIDNLKSIDFLNEIKFNIMLEEGNMLIKNLITTFKESVVINLNDTQLIVDNNKLKFVGYITLDFVNIDKFYSHFQINKLNRENIKKINFGFLFNLDEKFLDIDSLEIDGNTNQNLQKFLDNYNSNKENIFNKIVRRNLVKDFFKASSLD